ncbi:MAG: hypothetical protein O2884_01375 [Chloroflexi bacterium]|nr:hypothetical protein [Chloroflexota bacterium]
MNKTRIVVTMSAGLLALSALGGTAFAHWSPGNAEATYEKIAEDLGQEQTAVADAFSTASDEARDAAITERLAKLVEAGAITQAESDDIQAWYDSAPDAVDNMRRGRPNVDLERVAELLGVDVETLEGAAGDARNEVATEAYSAQLDAAVADGRITEEEAAAMLEQFENRPQREFGEGQRGQHGREFGEAQRGQHGREFGQHRRGGHGGGIQGFSEMRGMGPEAPDADEAPPVVDPAAFAA